MSAGLRLGQVEPRERAGAQTGRKYEYQYERTARAALDLLSDTANQVCVFCDWHDDFVIETGDLPTRYVFHQVKGRTSSQKPWSFREFFGVSPKTGKPSKNPAAVRPEAIVPRMLLHYRIFGDNCAGIAFVTNAGLDPVLSKFLERVARSVDIGALLPETRVAFDHVARAYMATTPPLAGSETEFFSWVQGLKVYTGQGQMDGPDAALLELADVVEQYSEIDLRQRQAKQIAREIVGRVRAKAAHCTTVVPTSDEDLRRDKGVIVNDLLSVLSLSAQAYEALKSGAQPDTVKTLSRLQRFCQKHGMESVLVNICEFKARWDIWRTVERHNVRGVDYVLLEERSCQVLQRGLTLVQIGGEAKDIAKEFAGVGATELEPEHVMGLIFSLAAQSEAVGGA